MNTKKKSKQINFCKIVLFVFLLCIFLLYLKFAYLSLSPTIYGKNMLEFASNRNTIKKTIKAKRGTIYDSEGNVLSLNVSSYTIILSLEKSKVYNKNNYVHDINETAEKLAPILGADVEFIKEKLSQDKYQVELGVYGRGLSELTKDQIVSLNLPGVSFTESQKRFYPNGNFASYLIGYAKNQEITTYDEDDNEIITNEIVGEMGIEAKYNKELSGVDGYSEYQVNKYGYKINDSNIKEIQASNGQSIYLTLDANIQRFVESAVKNIGDNYSPEWVLIGVMDAKTGDILGASSVPSFDPNIKNITDYENPLITKVYEPGSVMKTYTYMCAIENNKYDGNATYESGSYQIGEYTIQDWNHSGWGTVTFDKGYEYSSNVGIVNLLNKDTSITKKELKECFKKYGFGELTGIELANENKGNINFKYEVEFYNSGFGQGISTTAIQQLQALTIISNNGKMLKPHIVLKIVDSDTNKVLYKRKIKEVEVTTEEVTNKMKELMYNVIHGTDLGSTGYPYKIEGFDVIGKTGTSQIYDINTHTYSTGDNDYIFSFAGMYPKDNPEIIIYAAMKKPTWGKSAGLYTNIKELMQNIAKYKNMFTEITKRPQQTYMVKSYLNKLTNEVVNELNENSIIPIVVGNGDKITKQSIISGTVLFPEERIILLTNSNDYQMPNITNFSRNEVETLAKFLNIGYNINGYGYVVNQNIEPNTTITSDMLLEVNLENKYDIDKVNVEEE